MRGANLGFSGITAAQLYSTASYQARDLTGIDLETGNDNLAGANLAGQNFTHASVSGDLTGANLSHANLTNANFFGYDDYATSLAGANLSQADLTNANFFYNVTLTGANLSHANLTNANFYGTSLAGATLTGADARGANFQDAVLTGANTSNLIQYDGHIAGLDLTSGVSLVVRDYDGNPYAGPTGPLPIVVEQHLAMNTTGTLRVVFDADPWDSLISFAPGIPVTRGGTLELTFDPNVNIASQLGRTIDLFDWTGVNPTGAFSVTSPYTWNLSKLYTTGEVTLTALAAIPGDFNNNGVVDAADYIVWRKSDGTQAGYNAWRTHFGQTAGNGPSVGVNAAVPEPSTLVTLCLAAAGMGSCRRRAASKVSKTHQRVRLVNNPPFFETRAVEHNCASRSTTVNKTPGSQSFK